MAYLALSIWDSPTIVPTETTNLYNNILGALIYLFNSLIDIRWAHVIQGRQKKKRHQEQVFKEVMQMNDSNDANTMKTDEITFFRQVRKYSGHRRALLSAICFGIASFLAVLDWCVHSLDIPPVLPFYALSTHAYLVSAIFAVTGRRSRPWCVAFS